MARASPDSFMFRSVDMLSTYGIRAIPEDTLQPALRPRKQVVPLRDGAYDFGAEFYDERIVRFRCDSRINLTRQQIRELTRLLSQKGRIDIWNEDDKYYMGRLYEAAPLNYVGSIGHEFTLAFACDPFAYGGQYSGPIVNPIEYNGTPTLLTITNTGAVPIHNLTIRIRRVSS